MSPTTIQKLAAMGESDAIAAFSRIVAANPDDKFRLMRIFRAELPGIYFKWLDWSCGVGGPRR